MHSTMIEVDEDVFLVTTEREDGSIVVEQFFGRDAYERHLQNDMRANEQRDEHTLAGYFAERSAARRARRVAGAGSGVGLLH